MERKSINTVYDAHVKVNYRGLLQPELPQLTEDEQPPLGFFQHGRCVQFSLQIPGVDSAQKVEAVNGIHLHISQHDGKGRNRMHNR